MEDIVAELDSELVAEVLENADEKLTDKIVEESDSKDLAAALDELDEEALEVIAEMDNDALETPEKHVIIGKVFDDHNHDDILLAIENDEELKKFILKNMEMDEPKVEEVSATPESTPIT